MKRLAILFMLATLVLALPFSPLALADGGSADTQETSNDESPGLLDIVLEELRGLVSMGNVVSESDQTSPFTDDNGWEIHDSGSDLPDDSPSSDSQGTQSASSSTSTSWESGSTTQLEEQDVSGLDDSGNDGP